MEVLQKMFYIKTRSNRVDSLETNRTNLSKYIDK